MGLLDDARGAGFSEDEIGAWVNNQRDTWRAAGFSDQEIDQHLTGLKQPKAPPWALLDRFNGDDPKRALAVDPSVLSATTAKAKAMLAPVDEAISPSLGEYGITTDTPNGPAPRALDRLLGLGGEERYQTWPERMIRSGFTLAHDVATGEVPTIGADGHTNPEMIGRALDMASYQLVTTPFSRIGTAAVIEGREAPMKRAAEGLDETVGHAPTAQDFTDAAKVVGGGAYDGTIRQRLVDLYEEHGIHPAEAAHDAVADPSVVTALRDGTVPQRYAPATEPVPPPEPARPPDEPKATAMPAERPGDAYNSISADGIPSAHYARDGEPAPVSGGAGEPPPGPRPGGLGAPAEPPSRTPYFQYDDGPALQRTFENVVEGYKATFQPELVSDRALTADPLFARYKSMQQQARDAAVARAEDQYQAWRSVPEEARLDYMDRMERGEAVPGELAERAERHREMLRAAYDMEREAGSKAGYIQDYFPHIWIDPVRARAFTEARTAQLGPTWFQKERTFDLIRDGLDAGLRLKTTNPEHLVTLRLLSSADMVERMRLLRDLKDMGLATEAAGADSALARTGWSTINAPSREQWLISPDIQPLWKNAVEAKGLWANEGMIGSAFRGWMALKAVWVPIKLALSGFHPLHVLHINYTEGLARAWDQITKGGDVVGALKSAAEGVVGPMQAAIPGVPFSGKTARAAWLLPEAERTPAQRAAIELMNDGGFVPQITQELKINAKRSLESAWDNSEWFKMMPALVRRSIEVMQAPVFEQWIPNLKAAAYLNDTQALLTRRPELLDNAAQRRVALRTIAKSIDNRFGEMNYGGLFWNRTVKDAGIGSFLSLGWNLGFARELGGALLQPEISAIRRLAGRETETQATIRDARNKVAYVVAYSSTAMMIAGAMTYMFTGEKPEGLDYFFPRIGGTNPDGSPRRVATMFYTREIPMAMKHVQERGGNIPAGIGEMIWNKLMFNPIHELMQNRDYYGNDIWSENAPWYRQAWQGISHVFGEQLSPMSVSGARRSQQTGGAPWEMGLSFLGFGPAPSYAEKSATQNRIAYLFRRHVSPSSRPEETTEISRQRAEIRNDLLRAKQDSDQTAWADAEKRWKAAGGSAQGLSNIRDGITSDMSMFRALPAPDQQAIMENATNEERLRYQPFLKKSLIERVADGVVTSQRAANAGDTATQKAANRRVKTNITRARNSGDLGDPETFRHAIADEIIKRYGKELPGLIGAGSPAKKPAAPMQ